MKKILLIDDELSEYENVKNIIQNRTNGELGVIYAKTSSEISNSDDLDKKFFPEIDDILYKNESEIAAIFIDIIFNDYSSTLYDDKKLGYTIGVHIKERFVDIPIIVYSSIEMIEGIKKALTLDFDGFVSKTDFNSMSHEAIMAVITDAQNKRIRVRNNYSNPTLFLRHNNRYFQFRENINKSDLIKKIIVFMPYDKKADNLFDCISQAISRVNGALKTDYEPFTIKEDPEGSPIISKIFNQLLYSPMVISVITGNNPNVYFELGLTQAFNKPGIILVDKIEKEKPFVLRDAKIISYKGMRKEKKVDLILNAILFTLVNK
jgi:hypothetical protein